MKKNIFISVALIVLAVLAGCAQQSPYPHVKKKKKIRQVGDFVEGQSFDSSKFEVDVTYLDGTTETLKNTALSVSGNGADASNIKGGEIISITVGNDINGQPVKGEGTIGRVYSVSYIEATTAETSFVLPENASTSSNYTYWQLTAPQVFSVTAYYNGNQQVAVDAADYSVFIVVDTNAEGYDDATEVKGQAIVGYKVTDYTGLATAKTDIVDVTVTKEAAVDYPIASIESVTFNGVIAQYDYAELPEIKPEDVTLSVKYDTNGDGTADGEADTVKGTDLEGLKLELVDNTTELPLKDATFATNTTWTVKVKATLEDISGVGSVTLVTPTITVKYDGDKLVKDTELLAASELADDLYITESISGRKPQYAEIPVSAATIVGYSTTEQTAKPADGALYTGINVPGTLYLVIEYQGVYKSVSIPTDGVVTPPSWDSLTATASAELVGPAKQFYSVEAFKKLVYTATKGDIALEFAISNGTTEKKDVADEGVVATYYYDEQTPLADLEATEDGDYDLSAVDHIYILVVYGTLHDFVEVPLVDAEITELEAEVTPDKAGMVGSPVDVVINAVNDSGVVIKDYQNIVVEKDGVPAELPAELGTVSEVYTVYNAADLTMKVEDDVTIPAGDGYYELTGEALFVAKEDAPEVIPVGTAVQTAFGQLYDLNAAKAFKTVGTVDSATYTNAAPAISGYSVSATRVLTTGDNAVTVTVSYLGSDGKMAKATFDAVIEGTPYATEMAATPVLLYNGEEFKGFTQGANYNIAGFSISSESFTANGDITISNPAVKCTGKYVTETTVTGAMDSNYQFTFTYNTVDSDAIKETTKTLYFNLGVYDNVTNTIN